MSRRRRDDAELKEVMDNISEILSKKSDRINKAPTLPQPLTRLDAIRHPFKEILAILNKDFDNPAKFNESLSSIDASLPLQGKILRGLVWKERASNLFRRADYVGARKGYLQAIRCTLGLSEDYVLPCSTARNEAMTTSDPIQFGDVVACANNIAQCYIKEKEDIQALMWLEEVHCLYVWYGDTRKVPAFPWKDLWLTYEEYIIGQMKAWQRQSLIYASLGNTAAAFSAVYLAWKHGQDLIAQCHPTPPAIEKVKKDCNILDFMSKRHPDPASIDSITITNPKLQVRGVWKKLKISSAKGESPPSRLGFASVLWEGKYYVFGGEHATKKRFNDGWVVDLRHLENNWRRVPAPPTSRPVHYDRLMVHNKKAYLFQGNSTLPVFDLQSEEWSTVRTKMRDGTPWHCVCPGNSLIRYVSEVYQEKMYVFGGAEDMSDIGRNLFMALDFKTLTWDILGGTVTPKADISLPGLRQHAASWMSGSKMYVTLGSANRTGALFEGKEHGADPDFTYHDMWSYDIDSKTWTQEKLIGNIPSPRSEVGYTFNQKWDRAVVFGGYCPSLPLYDPTKGGQMCTFSYFGDTFVWSADTKMWSQVVTRGFPTYRALADIVTDQETGKTFLFGGYTNTDYTPSNKGIVQSFSDIWQLCIDVPGGEFEEADFELDPRFSKLGPWKRCFRCSDVGRWKMCGGTCRKTDSAAYFCSTECQRAAWAEHKKQNNCRKI